jgi:hypothetical protein
VGLAADRGGLIDLGSGGASIMETMSDLVRLEQENAELDHITMMVIRHQQTKIEVAHNVIAGRLSLPVAAARFRASSAELPSWRRPPLENFYPGVSQGERECRRVIAFVSAALWEEPSRRDLVVSRLESELREYLQRDGSVHLPEIDSPQVQPALVGHQTPAQVELR